MTTSFAPSESQDSFADLLSTIIIAVKGSLAEGGRYWAYLAIKPSMVASFKEAQASGRFNLEEYGTILEWGKGDEPPEDVVERMQTNYAVDSEYEKKLLERLGELE